MSSTAQFHDNEDDAGTVQPVFEKATSAELAKQELAWHQALSERGIGKGFVACLRGFNLRGSLVEIRTELIVGSCLQDVMADPRLISLIGVNRILDAFDRFLTELADFHVIIDNKPISHSLMTEYLRTKLDFRLRSFYSRIGVTAHEQVVAHIARLAPNSKIDSLGSPKTIFDNLTKLSDWPQLICSPISTIIHGDLHFGNLMLTAAASELGELKIRVVDGKDQPFPGLPPATGDPAYDYGKLFQSTIGQIDLLLAEPILWKGVAENSRDLLQNKNVLANNLYEAMSRRIEDELIRNESLLGPSCRERVILLFALQMITTPGAKVRMSESGATQMYLKGVDLLNKSFHRLSAR